ncbi:hypothetical protein [Xylanimonas cellulosilytica]|uniref:hypothetical protein n=1 Tax=Xylanimonas cellulosilytica TaxID=186189 RepID=UPI00019C0B72|nr:hypothetical protein [Xylanimonas cellulosilytica]
MDELLRQAMEPVLRDLRGAGLVVPRIEDHDWADHPDVVSVMVWSPDGSGTGVSVSRSAPLYDRVAAMADQVQEWAIEELWGRASTSWPECPRHPDSHPMRATVRDDVAVWSCPADGTPFSEIGAL